MNASAFAPGKLILMGEHAVVYGHPALAMAVDRGLTVHLEERTGPTRLDQAWIDDDRLQSALDAVLPADGVGVKIESSLPIGRGMGSSGALAVALAKAELTRRGEPLIFDAIDSSAFAVERIFHGSPSGIDHTVSMRGGTLRYQRTEHGPTFETVTLPPLPLVVIDSGHAGSTAEMVAKVTANRPKNDPYLKQIGALLDATMPALKSGDWNAVGQAWHENHWLLRAIGVSTPALDHIVRVAEDSGATGAKLAGAGGGGVVIALAPNPSSLLDAAAHNGWDAFEVCCHPAEPSIHQSLG